WYQCVARPPALAVHFASFFARRAMTRRPVPTYAVVCAPRFSVRLTFISVLSMSDSFFPRWRRVDGSTAETVVQPDEYLPWPQNIAMGAQHVVAMFGSTILAPLLMGFDTNVAILMSGVGTLIFFLFVRGRVPSYLGSSFAFIGGVIAVTGYAGAGPNANIGIALGAIIACGLVYTLIGLIGCGVN